ncbi:MAG: hypothetical protein OWU33_09930 [Firmicutes bacterium]|nr:hypothetical protein [Bacillota bacterium]
MKPLCPLCHTGYLEEVWSSEGERIIQCSAYPTCRFSTDAWERVGETVARFHHPVSPGL